MNLNPQVDLTPTKVFVKTRKNVASPKVKAKTKSANLCDATGTPLDLSGNDAKLLQHLERVLNGNEFTVISQTAIACEIEILLGSMTNATKKLLEGGRVIA